MKTYPKPVVNANGTLAVTLATVFEKGRFENTAHITIQSALQGQSVVDLLIQH